MFVFLGRLISPGSGSSCLMSLAWQFYWRAMACWERPGRKGRSKRKRGRRWGRLSGCVFIFCGYDFYLVLMMDFCFLFSGWSFVVCLGMSVVVFCDFCGLFGYMSVFCFFGVVVGQVSFFSIVGVRGCVFSRSAVLWLGISVLMFWGIRGWYLLSWWLANTKKKLVFSVCWKVVCKRSYIAHCFIGTVCFSSFRCFFCYMLHVQEAFQLKFDKKGCHISGKQAILTVSFFDQTKPTPLVPHSNVVP